MTIFFFAIYWPCEAQSEKIWKTFQFAWGGADSAPPIEWAQNFTWHPLRQPKNGDNFLFKISTKSSQYRHLKYTNQSIILVSERKIIYISFKMPFLTLFFCWICQNWIVAHFRSYIWTWNFPHSIGQSAPQANSYVFQVILHMVDL